MRKAKWICLEGSEGCGKTTYTKMLADHFTGKGLKVLSTKEPGTPLSLHLARSGEHRPLDA